MVNEVLKLLITLEVPIAFGRVDTDCYLDVLAQPTWH